MNEIQAWDDETAVGDAVAKMKQDFPHFHFIPEQLAFEDKWIVGAYFRVVSRTDKLNTELKFVNWV